MTGPVPLRSLDDMNSFFDAIRSIGIRRGPNRVLGGVCGGIASRWNLDVTIVRLIVIVLMILPVLSWVAYAIAWVLLPWQDGVIPLQKLLQGDDGSRPPYVVRDARDL